MDTMESYGSEEKKKVRSRENKKCLYKIVNVVIVYWVGQLYIVFT